MIIAPVIVSPRARLRVRPRRHHRVSSHADETFRSLASFVRSFVRSFAPSPSSSRLARTSQPDIVVVVRARVSRSIAPPRRSRRALRRRSDATATRRDATTALGPLVSIRADTVLAYRRIGLFVWANSVKLPIFGTYQEISWYRSLLSPQYVSSRFSTLQRRDAAPE